MGMDKTHLKLNGFKGSLTAAECEIWSKSVSLTRLKCGRGHLERNIQRVLKKLEEIENEEGEE